MIIKQFLMSMGLWYNLNLIRMIPDIVRWLKSGCVCVAPHPVKMMIVGSYLKKFSIDNFIETGTYLGETLGYIADLGVQCTSIELSEKLYQGACNRFKACKHVRLIHGDSGQKIPELLTSLTKPTLFWLDGHYSAGITATSGIHTPIGTELQAILSHTVRNHVILIDDARCFDGTNGYPHLDEMLRVLREGTNYAVEVSADIIRLVPRVQLS
jgi:hypothetical protein